MFRLRTTVSTCAASKTYRIANAEKYAFRVYTAGSHGILLIGNLSESHRDGGTYFKAEEYATTDRLSTEVALGESGSQITLAYGDAGAVGFANSGNSVGGRIVRRKYRRFSGLSRVFILARSSLSSPRLNVGKIASMSFDSR